MSKLTAKSVENVRPRERRVEIPDRAQRGLYLIVQPSGRRAFAVRYRHGGISRKLTLQAGITLAQARKLAADALFEVAQGHDPGETKKAAKAKADLVAADTVARVCEEWAQREGKRLRTIEVRRRILTRWVYPAFGDRQINDIKRTDIIRLLDKAQDASGPRMADMVLASLSRVFNWHAVRSDEFRSPIVRGMTRSAPATERARMRVLTDSEMRIVWRAAETAGTFGALIRFLLLTTARLNEAARMSRGELDGPLWTLPASRNKTKVDLERPLSETALELLRSLPQFEGCRFFFTQDGARPFSSFSRAKTALDAECGGAVGPWRLHDLRRTARSIMSRAGVPPDHAERVLGHLIQGERRTYDRHGFHSEKKAALEALAEQIERILNPSNNVTELRRRG
jgi:hypothetical protein